MQLFRRYLHASKHRAASEPVEEVWLPHPSIDPQEWQAQRTARIRRTGEHDWKVED